MPKSTAEQTTLNVTRSGFGWDWVTNQMEEEIVYSDDPEPLIDLVDHIRNSIPEDCAADEEDDFGDLPSYVVAMTQAQVELLHAIEKVEE